MYLIWAKLWARCLAYISWCNFPINPLRQLIFLSFIDDETWGLNRSAAQPWSQRKWLSWQSNPEYYSWVLGWSPPWSLFAQILQVLEGFYHHPTRGSSSPAFLFKPCPPISFENHGIAKCFRSLRNGMNRNRDMQVTF